MAFTVEILRSDRRTLALELREGDRVLVRAPRRASRAQIRAFVEQHRDWIEARLTALKALPAAEPLSPEELAALKKRGRELLPARTAIFAPLVGADYGRVSVRSQRTKWGSCSSTGNLSFNCLLLLCPPEVLDYAVVHELCHRLEMNHSARFWAQVERVLPDYRERRKWLRDHGAALLRRLPETEK